MPPDLNAADWIAVQLLAARLGHVDSIPSQVGEEGQVTGEWVTWAYQLADAVLHKKKERETEEGRRTVAAIYSAT
jgi:hypothetical protein